MLDGNDRSRLSNTLDYAICTVAQDQWNRLSGDIESLPSHIYASRSVENSLISLERLQKGGVPDYDEWDALLYLTWYQPRQINIVYSNIRRVRPVRRDPIWLGNGRIHAIDLGCGALATAIAILIAAADAYIVGHPKPEIHIDCIDSSPAMLHAGQMLWSEFVDLTKLQFQTHPLNDIVRNVSIETHTNLSTIEKQSIDRQCYVFAIHCAYEENCSEIESMVSRVIRTHNPVGLLMTTHKSKKDVLGQLDPSKKFLQYQQILNDIQMSYQFFQFKGKLTRMTEWRMGLLDKLWQLQERHPNTGVDFPRLQKDLSSNVLWTHNESVSRYYKRLSDDQLRPDKHELNKVELETDIDLPF